jgi:hypothetical protein
MQDAVSIFESEILVASIRMPMFHPPVPKLVKRAASEYVLNVLEKSEMPF